MIRRLLRTEQPERMDQLGFTPRALHTLADLERWNRRIGWTRLHLRAVERHWVALGRPRPFRVLDVGTGLGGLLVEIAGWAWRRGVPVELVGVELHPDFAAAARRRLGSTARVVQGDATALDPDLGRFDLGTCALMLHHVPPARRPHLVSALTRTCRSAWIFDLSLSVRGWLAAHLLPLAGMGEDTVHDGILSVRRACTFEEFQELVRPLPVRPARIFPTAMGTWPEASRARPG